MPDPKHRKVGDCETDCPPSGSGTANDVRQRVKALVEEVLRGQDACGATSSGEKLSGVTVEGMCPYLVDI